MADTTGIAWTDHTWNPWRGCQKVSEECALCYAEAQSKRNPAVLGEWGPGTRRSIAAEAYWRHPFRWDRQAELAGVRRRVFLGSLMDFNEDREDLLPHRRRAWAVVRATTRLDWLILTKRPERFPETLPADWGDGWPNVWLGATVGVNRWVAPRMDALAAVPARCRFLSCEPLLEDIALAVSASLVFHQGLFHWLIIGGESSQGGREARPFNLTWAGRLLDVCRAAGVAPFVKQFGSRPIREDHDLIGRRSVPLWLADGHGGDPAEWPARFNVREFPAVARA